MTQWRLCGLDQGPPGGRGAGERGGGKAPQNVTDVFVLISALLLLSFCLSIHRQLIHPSLLASAHPSLSPLPSNKPVCLSPQVLSCLCPEMHRRSFFTEEQTQSLVNICVSCINRVCISAKPDVWGASSVGRPRVQTDEGTCITRQFILS